MAKIISIFNNKGGVGKTTFVYHLAYQLETIGYRVLLVDGDPQCNLSIYFLQDVTLEKSWKPDGNSIYRMVEPLLLGTGDIRRRGPWWREKRNIAMYPGDVLFGDYEEELSAAWIECLAGRERGFRITTAIYRIVQELTKDKNFDFIFFDLGPNLGSLTRSLLLSSDYFISPMVPDAFSIRAAENFGRKLFLWSEQWTDAIRRSGKIPFEVPSGKPKFLGYVTQIFNIYRQKGSKFWQHWIELLPQSVKKNIVDVIGQEMVVYRDDYEIGQIKGLSSLVPQAQRKRTPIQELTGLKGTQHDNAKGFDETLREIANKVIELTKPNEQDSE